MISCPSCHRPHPADAAFCPHCGASIAVPSGDATATAPVSVDPEQTLPVQDQDADLTLPLPDRPQAAPRPAHLTLGGSFSRNRARFVPGDILNDRYRVVGLLGRGGMGEVYRAEDLKLDQEVALKFLPRGLEQDPSRLHLFLNEVRTARQVTHPNVCRVYDVDEFGGQHFLSMEYVDGEDLATSLQRTGRLPEERAVPVARQICAGLAAAHEQGILHRDLKPANVMIDGRGQVKLTDFGLAGLAAGLGAEDARAGTPAYMSPEQTSGREVTVRSDIYGLGLVLYEIFTGRPPFRADSAAEYRTLHNESLPSSPTQHVPGLDPAVERAIMGCLDKDPARRPASALAVSAALPGGDPLAAALAAGETPSPELMAEVGKRPGMASWKAMLLAAVAVALLAGGAHWAARLSVLNYLPLDKEPAVLIDRARELLATIGYDDAVYQDPVDKGWGLVTWPSVIEEVGKTGTDLSRWAALRARPDAAGVWYRQSPQVLMPQTRGGPTMLRGRLALSNPPPLTAGEVVVVMDLAGRLRRLEVMPRRMAVEGPSEPDWALLFAAAELDTARFRPTTPLYQRFQASDLRRAWLGTRADLPDVTLRVEAGAWEGRPVLFNVATPEALESLAQPPVNWQWGGAFWLQGVLQPFVIFVLVVFSVRVSRRNTSARRADRQGALRFASMVFFLFLLGEGLLSHTIFTPIWGIEIWPIIAGAVFTSVTAWAMYTAGEPLGRRIWPTMFVSSSRLFSQARMPRRDPLIGQSVLVGLIGAGLIFLLDGPLRWDIVEPLLGKPHPIDTVDLSKIISQRQALGLALNHSMLIGYLLLHIMALVLIRAVVRRPKLAVVLTLAVWVLLAGPGSLERVLLELVSAALSLFILLRWGVVAFIMQRVAMYIVWFARPLEMDGWTSQGSLILVGVLILLAFYGAWAAMGQGQGEGQDQRESVG